MLWCGGQHEGPGPVVLSVGQQRYPGRLALAGLLAGLPEPERDLSGFDAGVTFDFDGELFESADGIELCVGGYDAGEGVFSDIVGTVLVLGEVAVQPWDVDQASEFVGEFALASGTFVPAGSAHGNFQIDKNVKIALIFFFEQGVSPKG